MFKVIYEYYETKKWNIKRLFGNGGMPSSHSAVVACLATLIGKKNEIESPIFAMAIIGALIVMADAAGVRQTVGKQSKVLNEILEEKKTSNYDKLQEMTGHTSFQVISGAFIGFLTGIIF